MPTANIPEFGGDPDAPDEIASKLFLKKVHIQLRADQLPTDAERIGAVVDYLKDNSPAEKWYTDLLAGANPPTTWKDFEAAFVTRFPTPEKAERTPQEYEPGRRSSRMYTSAGRLLELAKLAGIDTTASGIWQARDALPEVIRDKVPAAQRDWKSFTDAIKGIDRVHIREGATKAKKALEMERAIQELRDKTRQVPTTPVSKMSAQLAQTALATPRANATPPAQNPFGAGGGRGNLFGSTPTIQTTTLTKEEVAKMKEVSEKLGRALLRDDAQGRAEYARRVTIWETAYAGTRPRLELVGYPLSPGTVPPGSGECFACGKITTPLHRSNECTDAARIPRKEATFRSLVGKYLRTAPVQVNAVADWMDWGDAEEGDFATGSSE
ncbi:hypothetical protein DFH09DRAFT_1311040 [Mycena vulgaris]|nr:hypothetical protein DFH09DRAFT_1311040 [Mycena vulgaris]